MIVLVSLQLLSHREVASAASADSTATSKAKGSKSAAASSKKDKDKQPEVPAISLADHAAAATSALNRLANIHNFVLGNQPHSSFDHCD